MSDPNNAPTKNQNTQLARNVGTDTQDGNNNGLGIDTNPECSICLESFREQEIGVLNACKHNFCLTCIQRWSESSQTCPNDRRSFSQIQVHSKFGNGVQLRTIDVEQRVLDLNEDIFSVDEEIHLDPYWDSDSSFASNTRANIRRNTSPPLIIYLSSDESGESDGESDGHSDEDDIGGGIDLEIDSSSESSLFIPVLPDDDGEMSNGPENNNSDSDSDSGSDADGEGGSDSNDDHNENSDVDLESVNSAGNDFDIDFDAVTFEPPSDDDEIFLESNGSDIDNNSVDNMTFDDPDLGNSDFDFDDETDFFDIDPDCL